jgi:hypothetical protein
MTGTELNSLAWVRERNMPTSERHLSAKLTPTFADRDCHMVSVTVLDSFWTGAATFCSKKLLSCTHEAQRTPFQTHYFVDNLLTPGIEPGTKHCLDNRFTDDVKVVSLSHWPRFNPSNSYSLLVLVSIRRRVNTSAIIRLEWLDQLKKIEQRRKSYPRPSGL